MNFHSIGKLWLKTSKPFCLSGVCASIAFSVETEFPTGILKSSLRIQESYWFHLKKISGTSINYSHLIWLYLTIISLIFSGNVLGIWICGCSLFYKREHWASKSAGAHSTKSLKISGCKRWCPKDLRVRASAAPALTHSLFFPKFLKNFDAICFSYVLTQIVEK